MPTNVELTQAAEPNSGANSPPSDPSLGLKEFLRRWEMNDFIFLVLIENLKPMRDVPPQHVAWFSIAPERWRETVVEQASSRLKIHADEAPRLIARVVTAIVFLLLALRFAIAGYRASSIATWLQAGFLTLAWFWLLLPTQNPWYWTWALPLLAFARGRAWLVLAGLSLIYYMRFWFGYQWPETPLLGTAYPGIWFFDFVVTWIEFAPWFMWLAVEFLYRIRTRPDFDDSSASGKTRSRKTDYSATPEL